MKTADVQKIIVTDVPVEAEPNLYGQKWLTHHRVHYKRALKGLKQLGLIELEVK